MRRLVAALLGLLLVTAAIGWAVAAKSGAIDLTATAHRLREYAATPGAPVAGFGAVAVGAVAGLPFTSMAVVAMLLFGAPVGAAITFCGALVGGSAIYLIGRFAARDAVDRWLARRSDPRLERLAEGLRRNGFIAVAMLRWTPIPFVVATVVLGATRVAYRDYFAGTALGVIPALTIVAVLTQGIDVLAGSGWPAPWLVIAVAVVAVIVSAAFLVIRRDRAASPRQDQ